MSICSTAGPDPKKRLLTVNQWCEAYGLSRATFYNLVAAGELKAIKLCGRTLERLRYLAYHGEMESTRQKGLELMAAYAFGRPPQTVTGAEGGAVVLQLATGVERNPDWGKWAGDEPLAIAPPVSERPAGGPRKAHTEFVAPCSVAELQMLSMILAVYSATG